MIIYNVAICFGAIRVPYILILKRLHAEKFKISSGNEITDNTTNSHSLAYVNQSELKPDRRNGVPQTSRAIHIKTMKMFGSITLIFVAMFIIMAGIFAQSIHNLHVMYIIYINHNTNFSFICILMETLEKMFWYFLKD